MMAPDFIRLFREQEQAYRTSNVLVLWGEDFTHVNAELSYANLDRVIEYIEKKLDDS